MLYQLPNGKVLCISIEEYLAMSDQELRERVNLGEGGEASSNAHYSSNTKAESKPQPEDHSMDYSPDKDDTNTSGPLDINTLPDQEI